MAGTIISDQGTPTVKGADLRGDGYNIRTKVTIRCAYVKECGTLWQANIITYIPKGRLRMDTVLGT